MLHKAWNSKGEMPYCFPRSSIKFQGHTGQNITDFDPNSAFPDYRPVAAFKSLRFALFKLISVTGGWGLSCKIATGPYWWRVNIDSLAWCRQVISHYLSQCWPRFMSPYGVTRPQWLKDIFLMYSFEWILHEVTLNMFLRVYLTETVRIGSGYSCTMT